MIIILWINFGDEDKRITMIILTSISLCLIPIGYYLHKKIESKYCESNKLYNIWKAIQIHEEANTRRRKDDWHIKRDQLQQQYDYELKNKN